MFNKGDKEYWQIIWDKFKTGDRNAFETIYNEFVDVLYAYGSKFTSDKSMLEDAIQDVFIAVYSYGKRLRQPEYLEFYLLKTLKHILIRKIKDSNLFSRCEDNILVFELKFSLEEMDGNEIFLERQFQLMQSEIKKMNSKKRELLFLKFSSGLTYAEIGEILNIKPDTAKKQVRRLLKYLRKKLDNSLLA